MNQRWVKTGGLYLVAWFTVTIFSLPLLVMVSGSLKSSEQLTRDPYSLWPAGWNWINYPEALASMPFLVYLSNTLLLCTGCVIGTTLSCALAAYGLSRVDWSGRRWMFGLVIATMLLPWHITMIPRFVLISELGLYNSLWSIVLPTFLGDAFFIFLLRQFFMTIPEQLLGCRTNGWTLPVGFVSGRL